MLSRDGPHKSAALAKTVDICGSTDPKIPLLAESRTLADEHRSRYQSELADSLPEIATTYSRLGHPEEAESARTEAVQIRSE